MDDELSRLLTGVNTDELWSRFFSTESFDGKFDDSLQNYLWQDLEQNNFVNQSGLDEEESLIFNEGIVAIIKDKNEEKSKIKKALEGYGKFFDSDYKENLNQRIAEINKEISKLNSRKRINSKENKMLNSNIEKNYFGLENANYRLESLKQELVKNFENVRSNAMSNATNKRADLHKRSKELEIKIGQLTDNANYLRRVMGAVSSELGKLNPKYAEALSNYEAAQAELESAKQEYSDFKVLFSSIDVEQIKYIKFLDEMTFEEFYGNLQDRNFMYGFDIDNVEIERRDQEEDRKTQEETERLAREEEARKAQEEAERLAKDEEARKAQEEEVKKDQDDNFFDEVMKNQEDIYHNQTVLKTSFGEVSKREKEALEEYDKLFDLDVNTPENVLVQTVPKQAEPKQTENNSKKKFRIRDIPGKIKDKIKQILPSLNNFMHTLDSSMTDASIRNNGNTFELSGIELQQSFVDRSLQASLLGFISSNSKYDISKNSYVIGDKKLSGSIRDTFKTISNNFINDNLVDSRHYGEIYNQVRFMDDYSAKVWFSKVPDINREDLLNNIRVYCNLDEIKYNEFLNKIGYVNKFKNTEIDTNKSEEFRNLFNYLSDIYFQISNETISLSDMCEKVENNSLKTSIDKHIDSYYSQDEAKKDEAKKNFDNLINVFNKYLDEYELSVLIDAVNNKGDRRNGK